MEKIVIFLLIVTVVISAYMAIVRYIEIAQTVKELEDEDHNGDAQEKPHCMQWHMYRRR